MGVVGVAGMHHDAPLLGADKDDIGMAQQQHPAATFHGDAHQGRIYGQASQQCLQIGLGRGGGPSQQAAHAIQALAQPFPGDGLEQVVHGVVFKGADGVLVVGGGKDEEGLAAGFHGVFQNVKPGGSGHLDVLKTTSGLIRAISSKAWDAELAVPRRSRPRRPTEIGQFIQGRRLVIHQQAADRCGHDFPCFCLRL
jgi:hypothetical protein